MDRRRLWPWNPITPLTRRGDPSLHHGLLHRLLQWFFHPPDSAPPATVVIRLMAGSVFFWEGVMKFVFPHTLGVGRFLKLGIPAPAFMASFVGVVEIVGGLLFIAGLFTRLAALPLLIIGTLSRAHMMRLRGRLMSAGQGLRTAMGALLVAVGIAVITGADKTIEAWLVERSPQWLTWLTTSV